MTQIPGGRFVRRRLVVVLIGLIATAALLSYRSLLIREYMVSSSSMEPTLHCAHAPGCRSLNSTKVIVSRVPYLFGSPVRGDIVVIDLGPSRHRCVGSIIVKRVVGLPNEVVAQRRDRLFIDGRELLETYLLHGEGFSAGPNFARTKLGRGQFFVMGDNRSMSCDSREFGPIDRSQIVGKVVARL